MLTPAQQAALSQIAAAAVSCEAATGCPAELTTAQCIFESAWLTRAPGNNCFGIKVDGHGAGQQYVLTHEFLDGSWQEMPLAFEKYATVADCFADHARLIQCGVYEPAWQQYQQDHDLDAYIAGVAAHYATAPGYRQSITAEAHAASVTAALQAARSVT
jgi:flagellum-specific peptidoglycan hydrolase FlgJ